MRSFHSSFPPFFHSPVLPFLLSFLLIGLAAGCETSLPRKPPEDAGGDATSKGAFSANAPSSNIVSPVRTGARVLTERGFRRLRGMRVGLITNHTARLDTAHLIDLIDQSDSVEVAALFGPEHGLRGTAAAGEQVNNGTDERTGAPVFSLYGERRRPSQQALAGLDALVYDIQDVGARFYTYITTMGLSMQAAARAGLPFFILDRPNPLGGAYTSGFVLNEGQQSFVGKYPIPIAYGLTVGELARMIQGEAWLSGLEKLDLRVVPVQGWQRSMRWPATGLGWTAPSPNIPDFETALVYAGACLFEATSASEGRGTAAPFKLLGAPWADGQALADTLNQRTLPGVRFQPARFTPRPDSGAAPNPKLAGQSLRGIRYDVTNPDAFQPVETGLHVLHAFYGQAQRMGVEGFIERPEWLAKLAGTDRLLEMLRSGIRPQEIVAAWQDAVEAFREKRQPYLLYE